MVQLLVEQGKLVPDPEVIKKIQEDKEHEAEIAVQQRESKERARERKRAKKKARKVFVEPQLPTTKPAPVHVQQLENMEDLF